MVRALARQLYGVLAELADPGSEITASVRTPPAGRESPSGVELASGHHFKKLTEAGLVTGERRGTWTYYRIVPEALAALAAVISPDTLRDFPPTDA